MLTRLAYCSRDLGLATDLDTAMTPCLANGLDIATAPRLATALGLDPSVPMMSCLFDRHTCRGAQLLVANLRGRR